METWKMVEPVLGDHIRVAYRNYYHHGIYIGNDEVIEFGAASAVLKPAKDVVVHKTSVEEFLQGGFLEVRQYNRKERKLKNSNEKIVEIANSKLGEGGYNFIFNNCEHFCNICVFNEKKSSQIDDVHEEVRKKLNLK